MSPTDWPAYPEPIPEPPPEPKQSVPAETLTSILAHCKSRLDLTDREFTAVVAIFSRAARRQDEPLF